jgi:uncharacterized protein
MRIGSADGLKLEAELDRAQDSLGTMIICHAHPRMQGTMNSPLLLAIRDDAVAHGWSVLRFNYRGVGDSEGEFGDGEDEISDARGALKFVRQEFGDSPVTLLGWSFGGAIALRVAALDEAVVACVAIAPAIERQEVPPASELGLRIPILIVCGQNDDVVPSESGRKWAEAGGATYVEIKAANHFFWAKYEAVTSVIFDWLELDVV